MLGLIVKILWDDYLFGNWKVNVNKCAQMQYKKSCAFKAFRYSAIMIVSATDDSGCREDPQSW